jgi:Protein of unknown function (DUF3024)
MSLTPVHAAEVLQQLGRFIEQHRPKAEIREQLDFRADIQGSEVFLSEVRPLFGGDGEVRAHAFAKIKWFKSREVWKLYWLRASGKWELYAPDPFFFSLEKALRTISADKHGCFFG